MINCMRILLSIERKRTALLRRAVSTQFSFRTWTAISRSSLQLVKEWWSWTRTLASLSLELPRTSVVTLSLLRTYEAVVMSINGLPKFSLLLDNPRHVRRLNHILSSRYTVVCQERMPSGRTMTLSRHGMRVLLERRRRGLSPY